MLHTTRGDGKRPGLRQVQVATKDPETGKQNPNGERGEICFRCATMMTRYHNRPEDTAKAIDNEGWSGGAESQARDGATGSV